MLYFQIKIHYDPFGVRAKSIIKGGLLVPGKKREWEGKGREDREEAGKRGDK